MTRPAAGTSPQAQNFNWMVERFAQETAGVVAAITVSSDGLLIATSDGMEGGNAERLGAISSAMLSLANGVSECHPIGRPDKIVIELAQGYLIVCTVSVGCALGVLASKQAGLGALAYEMAMFANRAASTLSPQLIEELKHTVAT
ncbi:roadblock/LC7 domain-containing protein [Pseudonocardia sp. TRM90224]|uniref:roadblock/LC7 domain-containing protein n=1 Tax=Pseudonocardia sp. TRM90224 TaxID=2812678 RepID=UPI001E35F228|nr:roadblock/LC7 domain-containing protein [Pseudonocardia sp. TRM90224]